MRSYYNESHHRFRKELRAFIEEHISPDAPQWDEDGERPSLELNQLMGQVHIVLCICMCVCVYIYIYIYIAILLAVLLFHSLSSFTHEFIVVHPSDHRDVELLEHGAVRADDSREHTGLRYAERENEWMKRERMHE